MSKILIKNGRIIDPVNKIDDSLDLLINKGKIEKIAKNIKVSNAKTIDAKGKYVVPGLIDMHTHLRVPGREDEETIYSGTCSAAAGGFTSICTMPNTDPVIDTQTGIKFILSRAQTDGIVNIFPVAAITKGVQGEEITEFGDLVWYGAIAFSDDGKPVMNAEIMRIALQYTSMFDVPILSHCEDLNLSRDGVINEGYMSTLLGLPGMPAASESAMISRDIELAEFTGGRLHICHTSAKRSVELIRKAKKRGVNVTAEVTPHHLTLTDECVKTFDTYYKVNPPLRTKDDIKELIKGIQDGTIDVIATDHAPHTDIEKDMVFLDAPFGMIGMQTAVPVIMTHLVHKKIITINRMIEMMSTNPAKILRLNKGTLSIGADADVTIIDPQKEWIIIKEDLLSRSFNCPFINMKCKGSIDTTIVGGKIVYQNNKIVQ